MVTLWLNTSISPSFECSLSSVGSGTPVHDQHQVRNMVLPGRFSKWKLLSVSTTYLLLNISGGCVISRWTVETGIRSAVRCMFQLLLIFHDDSRYKMKVHAFLDGFNFDSAAWNIIQFTPHNGFLKIECDFLLTVELGSLKLNVTFC